MSTPFISIIIPTFNEEQHIGELVEYLQESCYDASHEIIVADGGSTDNTREEAKGMGATIVRCKKKGRAAQMNEGAKASHGSILYFLHADTTPPKDFLNHIKTSIKKGYKSGCFQLTFDDPHPILKFYGWCTRFQLTVFRFGDQSLYVEKKLFLDVGGFDESLTVMEDQEIVRQLKKKGTFSLINASVTTSSRRYKVNGIIRLQFVFFLIVILYYGGASQTVLVHVYNRFINNKK